MDHDSTLLELDDAFVQDPYSVYAKLGTEGSAHRVRMPPGVPLIGGLPVWLVTGYDAVRSALADPRLSTDLNRIEGCSRRRSRTAPSAVASPRPSPAT